MLKFLLPVTVACGAVYLMANWLEERDYVSLDPFSLELGRDSFFYHLKLNVSFF